MRSLQPMFIMLLLAFMMSAMTCQIKTNILERFTCPDQLMECKQNLEPIYHQPAELSRAWQNCRTSVLEEKLRTTQLELQVTDLQINLNNLKATLEFNAQNDKTPAGVEGLWLAKTDEGEVPTGAMSTLNDGTLKSHFNYIGRTKVDEKEDIIPCRTYDKIECHYILGNRSLKSTNFEVLINNSYEWKWTNSYLPIPENAVVGGYRETLVGSELFYIGRALHNEFINYDFKENLLLVGQVEGRSRKLFHTAWGVIQKTTYYQILVAA